MKNLFLLTILLFASVTVALSDGIDPPPPAPGEDNGPEGIPVDGGVSFLIAAGGAVAYRKLKSNKTKNIGIAL